MIIPIVAYIAAQRDLTPSEHLRYERYAYHVCGPEGAVDMDPVADARGRYYAEPHCNRNGWNGHHYREHR